MEQPQYANVQLLNIDGMCLVSRSWPPAYSKTEAFYVGHSAISSARAADGMKKLMRKIHRRSKWQSSPHAPLSKVAFQVSS